MPAPVPQPELAKAPPALPPVRGSLAAAVAEIERAAVSAGHLQSALSPLLRRGGEGAEAAQSLDEITQHLQGLAEFLAVIARDCPADWRLDVTQASARLRLHSQKLRLTGPGTSAAAEHVTGELELW